MSITIRASEAQREQYVQNILKVWHSADARQMDEGRNWYRTAHKIALLIGDGDVKMGAGIIAALSVRKTWDENLRLAREASARGSASGHVSDCVIKANTILNGADPEKVLAMRRKTGHFYRCIVNPADPEPVCIDRHAHDVMVNERYGDRDRGLGAHGRYELVAECYREAARRLHEIPQVVQAVTWTAWTDKKNESR